MKRWVSCFLALIVFVTFLPPVSAKAEAEVLTASVDLSSANAILSNLDAVKYGTYNEPKTECIGENDTAWVLDNTDENGYYIGFDLSDNFANMISDGSVFTIEVDYFSRDNGFFHIVYDSQNKAERHCDAITTGDSDLWKTAVVTVDDAYFGNRVMGKYDFILTIESPRYYKSGVSAASVPVKEVRVTRNVAKNKITHYGYTNETGNVFPWKQNEKLLYNEFSNTTDEKLSAEVTFRAVDSSGVTGWSKSENIELGAREKKTVAVNVDSGYCQLYTLYVDIKNDEKEIDISYKRYNFAIVKTDPYGIKNENYYLAAHFQHYGENVDAGLDVIEKSNTYGVRTEYGWTHVYDSSDRTKNLYKDEDKAFHNKLKEHDLHLLAVYAFSVTAETGGWKYIPKTNAALESWEQGIEFITENTKGLVERIEIWNEPDVLDFNGGVGYTGSLNEYGVKESPEIYAEAAKHAYNAAKKGNPDVKVGVMSLVNIRNSKSFDFFEKAMIDSGLQNYADAVTLHPYSDGSAEHYHNMAEYEKKFMDTLTTDKNLELWNTEYGFSTTDNATLTDIKQARHMVRTPIHLMGEGVGDVNVGYNFARKGLVQTNREDNFGIVSPGFDGGEDKFDKHFVPRQAYVSVTAMNYYMAQAEPDGMGNYGAEVPEDAINEFDSEHIYKFNSEKFGADIYVMWRTEKEVKKELDLGVNSIIIADMYGNEQLIKSDDGKYTLTLGISPQYVIVKQNQSEGFSIDKVSVMYREDGKWKNAEDAEALRKGDSVKVVLRGYNPTAEINSAELVTAQYNKTTEGDIILAGIDISKVSAEPENLIYYEKEFNVNQINEADVLKCFVWDINTMVPSTNSIAVQ